jgi:hypothetical protein
MSELQQHQSGPAHFHLRGEDLEEKLRSKKKPEAEVWTSKILQRTRKRKKQRENIAGAA